MNRQKILILVILTALTVTGFAGAHFPSSPEFPTYNPFQIGGGGGGTTYNYIIEETGLASGTSWWANATYGGAVVGHATTTGTSITLSLAGGYDYTINWGPVNGYIAPASKTTGTGNGGSWSGAYTPMSVSISSSQATVDAGQSFTLTATTSASESYAYQWYTGTTGQGTAISGATSSTYTTSESAAAGYMFYVTITYDGASASSATFTETVDSALSLSVSSSLNPSDTGQSVTFTASASGGSGSYSSYAYTLYDGSSASDATLATGSTSAATWTYSGTGSFLIAYSVTDSNSYTASATFTQSVNSDPSVSIAAAATTLDSGQNTTLTATVSGGTGTITYQWYEAGNPISGATTGSYSTATLTQGSYSYYVIATDSAGFTTQSNTVSLTVNSDPTISATSNVSVADVGYTIEFSSSPSGGTGPYTYSWMDGSTQLSTTQDFSYSFSSTGSHTLTVTVTDSRGYTYSASVTVTVNPNPTVTITSSQNPTDAGSAITFWESTSGGTGTITYQWYLNGITVSNSASYSLVPGGTGGYVIHIAVTVTDSDGHTSTASFTETVNPDPSVSISASADAIDAGTNATFTASASGGTGTYSYAWYIAGTEYTGGSSITHQFNAPGSFAVYVIVTDGVSKIAQSNIITETVNPDPTVNIAGHKNVDAGINDTLTGQPSGGTGTITYQWYLNGSAISGATAQTYVFNRPAGTYNISLIATDSQGLTGSSYLIVTVNPDPSASIEGPTQIDKSPTVTYLGNTTYGTAPYVFYWYINGVNTSSGLYYDFTPPTTGTYNFTLLVQDATGHEIKAYLDVQVASDPTVTISDSTGDTLDAGMNSMFKANVVNGVGPFTYQWSSNGNLYSYGPQLSQGFQSAGTYNISLTVRDAQGVTASAHLTITVNPDPSVHLSASYAVLDTNMTDVLNLTAAGGTGSHTTSWTGPNGAFTPTGAMYTNVSFSKAGVYTFEATITDSLGISATAYISIVVNAAPQVSIVTQQTTYDAHENVSLRSQTLYGTGPYQYEWIVDGKSYNQSSTMVNFPTPGNYSAQIIITDAYEFQATRTVYLTILSDPTSSMSIPSGMEADTLYSLSASTTGGKGPYSYQWVFAGGSQESGQTVHVSFANGGNNTWTLITTDGTGYHTQVTGSAYVALKVSIAANETQGWGPLSIQFQAEAQGGSGYTWNWTFGDGGSSILQDPYHTFAPGNYTVSLIATDTSGQATGEQIIHITSLPQPFSFTWSPDTNITVETAVSYTVHTAWDAPSSYTVLWEFPNGQTARGNATNYTFPVYSEYSQVTAWIQSGSLSWNITETVHMVPANPSVSFTLPQETTKGSLLELTGSGSAPDAGIVSWTWTINGTVETGQTVFYSFNSAGNITVTLTVKDSLGVYTTATEYIKVVIPQDNTSISISVSSTTNGPITKYTVLISALNGTVQSVEVLLNDRVINVSASSGTYSFELDSEDYNPGNYNLTIVAFITNGQSKAHYMVYSISGSVAHNGLISDFFTTLGPIGIIGLISALGTIAGIFATLRSRGTTEIEIDGTILRGNKRGVKMARQNQQGKRRL